ncbi:MAG TPA: hypothetical protein VID71_01120 [Steroidobacteraceae bacterium]|jgi:hypothetical protein
MMRFWNTRYCAGCALAALALAALALSPAPAHAGMPLQPQVTGQVSSVEGSTAVRIDGTTYLIAPNSPAADAIRSVRPGDTIGLVLNGPPGSSTSEVISISRAASGATNVRAGG